MVVSGLFIAALLNVITGAFLKLVYPGLMRVNTGAMDWSLPAVLGAVLALILFPYRSFRRLPFWLLVSAGAVAGISSVIVTMTTEPPIGRAHISIAIALSAFVVAGTLKAIAAAAFMRPPTTDDVAQGAVEMAVGMAGAVVFGALGAAAGGGKSGDADFCAGGGSFGGGGASGAW